MANISPDVNTFVEAHSGELLILVLFLVIMIGLVILVPQLLRAHLRRAEMVHQEHMRALEQGQLVPEDDQASRAAGRTAGHLLGRFIGQRQGQVAMIAGSLSYRGHEDTAAILEIEYGVEMPSAAPLPPAARQHPYKDD